MCRGTFVWLSILPVSLKLYFVNTPPTLGPFQCNPLIKYMIILYTQTKIALHIFLSLWGKHTHTHTHTHAHIHNTSKSL